MVKETLTRAVKNLKAASAWRLVLIAVVLSVVLTGAVVASMSVILTGRVDPYYMAAGALTALLVSSVVAFIVIVLARDTNEAFYHTMLEDLPELICRWMPDGTISFVNESYCRYFGKMKKELVGRSITSLISEKERERMEKHVRAAREEAHVVTVEHRVMPGGKDTRWLQSTVSAVYDDDGGLKEFQSIAQDITERKLAEEKLKRSEERYRNLVKEIHDGFAVTDDRGKVTFANKALAGILGFETPEEVVGRDLTEFFHPSTRRKEAMEFKRAFETGKFPEIVVSKVKRKDGSTAFVEVKPVLVVEQDVLVGSMGVIRDITGRMKMEDELKHRLDEVERLNKLMVGRELKMEQFRKEIVRLRDRLRMS